MVRLITVCALVIAAWPPVAAAQEASSSLEALFRARELRRGVGIYVTDETGQRMKGKVIDLSGTLLTVETRAGATSIETSAIRRIELPDSTGNGIMIGLGLAVAGTFLSCGIESAANEYCYGTAYAFWPILGVGAFVGAMVDATRHKTLYEAADAKRVTVAPVVSRAGLSVRASIEW